MDTDIINAVERWINESNWANFFNCCTVARNCTAENIPAMREASSRLPESNSIRLMIETNIRFMENESNNDWIDSFFA